MSQLQDEYFQDIIANYEDVITEITQVLDEVKVEHNNNKIIISNLLTENEKLNNELKVVTVADKNPQLTYTEDDVVKNLQEQVGRLTEEKQFTTKLWSISNETIEILEEQLKIYESNTDGFVPKGQFTKTKKEQDQKIEVLEKKLKENEKFYDKSLSSLKEELNNKNKELKLAYNTKDNTFKIIKNLEDEIIKLQDRLGKTEKMKVDVENNLIEKNKEILFLQSSNEECKRKVSEALELIETAIQQKEIAELSEKQSKNELEKLSQDLLSMKGEYEKKIEEIKKENERKMMQEMKSLQDEIRLKTVEIEKLTKECALLQNELKNLKYGHLYSDDSNTSKLLVLEKNLENTFQKLLLSEKQNIQLTSERDSIKNDLEQMAGYYQRDISARETEKLLLKKEIQQLKIQLDEMSMKMAENLETTNKIQEMENEYKTKLEHNVKLLQEKYEEKLEIAKEERSQKIDEIKTQLYQQIEKNKKWRLETKNIVEKLEKKIVQMKNEVGQLKSEKQVLTEQLKDTNAKLNEHLSYLNSLSRTFIIEEDTTAIR